MKTILQTAASVFLILITFSCKDKSILEPQPKAIGEFYEGGYVFYVDDSGEHGLIAAPADDSTNLGTAQTSIFTFGISGITGTVGTKLQKININLNHSNVGNIAIQLKAPSGQTIYLSNLNGGTGDNYTNTTFATTSTNSISSGIAPFTGTYSPQNPFSGLSASTANGTWTISVLNNSQTIHGQLLNFSLTFTTAGTYSFYTINNKNKSWDKGLYLNTSAYSSLGKENTTKIINACLYGKYAARVCEDLDVNGKNDWFLPSKQELELLCKQKASIPGISATGTYWSSSEYSSTYAYKIKFSNDSTFTDIKNSNSLVRAIRSF